MSDMKFVVQPWTLADWNRVSLAITATSESIPDINCRTNVVWLVNLRGEEARSGIRSAFEEHLLAAPDQRSARFSVLRFYFEFREPLVEEMASEEADEVRAAMDRDFKYFLDLPPHLEETTNKDVLLWEQRQAWLARYWRRLELISETISQIGGAERSEPRLDLARLLWAGVPRPSMPLPQALKDPGMLESGWLGPFAPDRAVATEDRGWLRKAAINIEGAAETGGEVRPFYKGILADCHALTGNPILAARIWEDQQDEIIRD